MRNFGFVKVAAASPRVHVADCVANAREIIELAGKAQAQGVNIVAFPELSVTGYTCADLFNQSALLSAAELALMDIIDAELDVVTIVGVPVRVLNSLYNCAAVIYRGILYGLVPKECIPNYSEFYESRWFASGMNVAHRSLFYAGQEVEFGSNQLFAFDDVVFGVELCEDLWVASPKSSSLAQAGANIIFNLSATPEIVGKNAYIRSLVMQQSARTISAYVYASAGVGESSTDLVFTGNTLIAENGVMLASSQRFTRESKLAVADIDIEYLGNERSRRTTFVCDDSAFSVTYIDFASEYTDVERRFNPTPFIPQSRDESCREIFSIQTAGLAQRLEHTHSRSAVVGISGGLDSTLALLVTVKTFDLLNLDRKGIVAVTMPGFGTTDRTYTNALALMENLGVTMREISIKKACLQHFQDIGLSEDDRSAAYENSQARERTQLLMDIANMESGLVIGTGDLSEAALGWATYNGDHMSMYNVNCSIPKTLVRVLVDWVADNESSEVVRAALKDIIDTPVSPELLPADKDGNIAQKTEDLVGPYELHDFFLYHFIRNGFEPNKIFFLAKSAFENMYDEQTIEKWLKTFLRRFFAQQYKRSAVPDGPKVGSVALSPRGDWRMPSDALCSQWLEGVDLPMLR